MLTVEKPQIQEALQEAETQAGHTMGSNMYQYYLLVALVWAVCEVADAVRQLAEDLPSNDAP